MRRHCHSGSSSSRPGPPVPGLGVVVTEESVGPSDEVRPRIRELKSPDTVSLLVHGVNRTLRPLYLRDRCFTHQTQRKECHPVHGKTSVHTDLRCTCYRSQTVCRPVSLVFRQFAGTLLHWRLETEGWTTRMVVVLLFYSVCLLLSLLSLGSQCLALHTHRAGPGP